MASRRRSIRFAAVVLSLVACTSGTPAVEPTTPPDVFAPTPSIDEVAPPTTVRRTTPTTADVERNVIYPVDPVTLEAQPGFEPIPMGDWAWGVSSPNGRWLALMFAHDNGSLSGVRLIDIPAWEMVGEWPQLFASPMTVTDDGAIYTVTYSAPLPRLIRAEVGSDEPEKLTEFSSEFSPWDQPRLWNDQILLVGQIFDSTSAQGGVEMVTVDTATGGVVQTPIPGITVGPNELIEFGEDLTGVIDSLPALVWDEGNGRLLIVHATEDVVTEFDAIARGVTKHRFGPRTDASIAAQISQDQLDNADLWASTHRSAALSQDGSVLYLAGLIGEFAESDDFPRSVATPSGILAIDTSNWEIIDRLDAPISDLFMSPDGQRLIAGGYTQGVGEASNGSESSGLYVINPVDLEVIVHHPPGIAEQYFGNVSYSREGSLAYISSYGNVDNVDVLDLETGAIVNNRTGVQVFGEVATVADPEGG